MSTRMVAIQRKAYAYGYDIGPRSTDEQIAERVAFFHNLPEGWIEVGIAEIAVVLHDRRDMTANAVKTLRAEQESVRAEAGKRLVELEEQINSLLAIEHVKEAA